MAEIANGSVFSQTDASNSGALPGITGSSSPALIDNSIQALMGAIKREHDWRNFTVTSSGSANAYVLTYAVAPAAYYTGQAFGFITNFAVTGSATVNVNSLGAKTIKKLVAGAKTNLASGDISSGDFVQVVYDGTDFVWVNKGVASVSSATDSAAGVVELATTTEVLTGTDTSRAVTPDSLAALWEQGSDVASAGTISLGEGGYFNITGTTTITDIDLGTDKAGRTVWLKFADALTLTHSGTTLILPGGASITTAAGDTACFVSEGSDVVRCVSYNKASGEAVVAATSGWEIVETLNPSSVATVATTVSLTGYKAVRFTLFGLTPATNSTQPKLEISSDGTSYSAFNANAGAYGAGLATADTSGFLCTNQVSNTASNGGVNGHGTLYNTNAGERVLTNGMVTFNPTGGASSGALFSGVSNTITISHIRFSFSSGNIASGVILIEGLA